MKCREHIKEFRPCELHMKAIFPDKVHTQTLQDGR